MHRPVDRRDFLKGVASTSTMLFTAPGLSARGHGSPNDRLDLAVVGVAGRGGANLAGVAEENVVALCDVDAGHLAQAAEKHRGAKLYRDFRKMFDAGGFDAVVVSTPDHTHFLPAALALRAKLHVYCEKPLSWSVAEARELQRLAAAGGGTLATQMGTQIHAGDNYRRVVELVRAGAIGPIRECHVWCGKTWSGGERPKDEPAVPANLDWELWLGPAPARPYHPAYHPAGWRRWWDFGGGTLGDMGCHYVDLAWWALDLRHPVRVEADGPERHPETTPPDLHVRWDFPARGSHPELALHWYDTGRRPPQIEKKEIPDWGNGVLFVGEKGSLLADYGRHLLLPEEAFTDLERPAPSIPSSLGHHREWIEACKKGGGETTCSFDYSGPLTEAILLGNIAFRVGRPFAWDGAAMRSPDCDAVGELLGRVARAGWTL